MTPIRVAIVEDSTEIRSALKLIINSCKELVCESDFGSAEDAINGLKRTNTDVVLLDIELPGISGIDAIKLLKEISPDIQCMMLTSYEDDELIFESLKAGACGYLVKKSSLQQIVQAVTDAHDGGSPMSPGIARKVINLFKSQLNKPEANYHDLSDREREIIDALASGFRYKEIAEKLFISQETVRTHIRNIYQKLQVQSRTDALNKVFPKR